MSDNGHADPDPEVPDPDLIEEAIRQALESIGVDPGNMGEVFVQQVTGDQLNEMMHSLSNSVDIPESSWIPRFMSEIVRHNTLASLTARDKMSHEELAWDEDEITLLADEMPELSLKDHDAYLVWKQQALDLITIVDKAVERYRDDHQD